MKVLIEGEGMEALEKMVQVIMVMVHYWEEKAVGERMVWQEKVHHHGVMEVEKREKEQAQENIGNMVLRLVHRYVELKFSAQIDYMLHGVAVHILIIVILTVSELY